MKYLFTILFVGFFLLSEGQQKIELGLTTEASWVMKDELTYNYGHVGKKQNWGTALGIYLAVPVWWRFSVSTGVSYRYSILQRGVEVWSPAEGGVGGDYLSGYDFRKYERHYWVIPANLRFNIVENWFITGGIEYCRLLNNYDYVKNKQEYNWTVGIGNQKHQLRWSLNYLKGFENQKVKDKLGTPGAAVYYFYQTNRLQLNLSFPLWKH